MRTNVSLLIFTIMQKIFTFGKGRLLLILFALATAAVALVFNWSWVTFSSLKYHALSVVLALLAEDVLLLLLCRHCVRRWKYKNDYCLELTDLSLFYLLCFMILATVVAVYAWVNIWLFAMTVVVALVVLYIGICIWGLAMDDVFGCRW